MKLLTLALVFMAIITCSTAVIIDGRQVNRKPNLYYIPVSKRSGTVTQSTGTDTNKHISPIQRENNTTSRRRLVRRRDCNKQNDTTSNSANTDDNSTDVSSASDSNKVSGKKIVNLAVNINTDETSQGNIETTSDLNGNDNGEQTTSKTRSKSKSTESSPSETTGTSSNKNKDKSKSSNTNSKGTFKGQLTWFGPKDGACENGDYGDNDMVVALNEPQYGDPDKISPYCSKCASVTGNKGTVVVKIIDVCPECEKGSLDATKGAFDKITSSDGVGDITWSWVDC